MKYHTTPTTIIVSCLLLALSIVLVWAGMSLFGLQDPGTIISQDVIASFNENKDLRIEFSSMDRDIWKAIELNQVSVSLRDENGRWHKALQASSVRISIPIQKLLFSFISGNNKLSIEIQDPSIEIDRDILAGMSKLFPSRTPDVEAGNGDGTNPKSLIDSWLSRTAFDIRLLDGRVTFRSDTATINATGLEGSVALHPGLVPDTSRIQFSMISGNVDAGTSPIAVELTSLGLTLRKNATNGYRLSATLSEMRGEGNIGTDHAGNAPGSTPFVASISDLLFLTDLQDFNTDTFLHALLQYQFGGVEATYGTSRIHLPSATGSISLGSGVSWTASLLTPDVDVSTELDGKLFSLTSPNWEVNVVGDALDTIGISVASTGSPSVALRYGDTEFCSIDGLVGQLDFDIVQFIVNGRLQWDSLLLTNPDVIQSLLPENSIRTVGLPISHALSSNTQINLALTNGMKHVVVELYSELSADLTWKVPSDASGTLIASLDYDVQTNDYNIFADIDALQVESVPGETSVSYSWLHSVQQNQMVLDVANKEAGISANATYDLVPQDLTAKLRFDEFAPAAFRPLIGSYAPVMEAYMDDTTRVVGNIQLTAAPGDGTVLGWDGRGTFELGIIDLKVGKRYFNGATTFVGTLQSDDLNVETFTATTEGYRLQYQGDLVLDNFLPEGELSFSTVQDGRQLLRIDFSLLPPDSYSFAMDSEIAPNLTMLGKMNWQSGSIVNSEAVLTAWDMTYPLLLTVDFNTFSLRFATDGLSLSAVLNDAGHSKLDLVADSFDLPRFSDRLPQSQPLEISGAVALDVPLDTYDWSMEINDFLIQNLPAVEETGTIGFNLAATDAELKFSDFKWDTGKGDPLEGSIELSGASLAGLLSGDLKEFKGLAYLQGNPSETVSLSLYANDLNQDMVEGLIEISSLDIGRFFSPLGDMVLNFSAIGSSDMHRKLDVDGSINMVSQNFVENPTHLSADLHVDENLISLGDISIVNGNLVLRDGSFDLDCMTGDTSVSIEASLVINNLDRPREYGGTFSVDTSLPIAGGVFGIPASIPACKDLISVFTGPSASAADIGLDFAIRDVVLGSDYSIPDADYHVGLDGDVASIHGGPEGKAENITGTYRLSDGAVDLLIDPSFLFGFHMTGMVTPKAVSVDVSDIYFPLPIINITFIKPIVWFLEGDIHGDIRIEGDPLSPDFYGMAWADRIDATTFWLPDDVLSLKNPVVTIEEGFASSSWTTLTSTNVKTGKIAEGEGKASCNLDGWMLDYYQLDARLPDDSVYVWIPIPGPDIDIKGYGKGEFTVYGEGSECWLSGPVSVSDTTVSFGIKDLPAWYVPAGKTSTNMEVTTGKNVNFYFPTEDSPIISATIDEGQRAAFSFEHRTKRMTVDGDLGFRSGEIYYFQKNFYITEGSLKFRTDAFTQAINPVINLRARIRDFDSNGNKVDIYLVLQDSTLDNIAPRFESVPSLTTNEILEILGQSILPSSAYGQVNVSSVVSLAATATDVISRLGIIDTGSSGLTRSIKDSLGLDMFTMRSNIVQNILFDVLPGTNLVSSSASPLARYLDNTTIYLGKYLGRDFFLQGMIHFSAAPNGIRTGSFLADDLAVDMELSVEWANPMCTFSLFTQPEELSLFNILDTIGFSVTKRIEF